MCISGYRKRGWAVADDGWSLCQASGCSRRTGRGEAFFAVAAEAARPFEVAAESGTVRALGTAFNVRTHGPRATVAVAEGWVRVTAGDAGSVDLAPGEVARYGPNRGITTSDADVSALTTWREGRIVLADRPLRAVMTELDRHRPGIIVVLDTTIADERFSGVFDIRNTGRALDAIERTLPVDVVRVTPLLMLVRPRDQ